MSWLTDLFSGGVTDLLDSGLKLIDDFHTSDGEKQEAKHKFEAMVRDFEIKTQSQLADYDKEVTERHKNDMTSDSWLSKNIRPLGLVFMLVSIVALVYLSTFTELTRMQYNVLTSWIGPVISLLGAMVTFYYGSRGMEKINKIRKEK